MALDPSHRSSIYRKLVPILGDEDARELMTQISSHDADELVTKDFFRAELLALETRLTVRLGAASAAVVAVLASLRLFT
ncbi:MAG: hypothetical protein U5K30_07990 [Acidimicrobiales bacterium]|nr:hypothetical protein [Acidimicrobiales bacterium]